MKYIPLSQNKVAIVDDEDYDYLMQWKWYFGRYAIRGVYERRGGVLHRSVIAMHAVINRTPAGLYTDHINGDKLDNRKCNLRTATASQNGANKKRGSNNTSGYKGVHFHAGKWEVNIETRDSGKRKSIYLGRTADIKKAAQLYNQAARELFGEYAKENEG